MVLCYGLRTTDYGLFRNIRIHPYGQRAVVGAAALNLQCESVYASDVQATFLRLPAFLQLLGCPAHLAICHDDERQRRHAWLFFGRVFDSDRGLEDGVLPAQ